MKINNAYNIGDTVYMTTDPEQNKGVINAIVIMPNSVLMYSVTIGVEDYDLYEFHISPSKNVIMGSEKE